MRNIGANCATILRCVIQRSNLRYARGVLNNEIECCSERKQSISSELINSALGMRGAVHLQSNVLPNGIQ